MFDFTPKTSKELLHNRFQITSQTLSGWKRGELRRAELFNEQ